MRTLNAAASIASWTGLAVMVTLAASACSSVPAAPPAPRLEASSQPAGGSVVIDLVSSPEAGFVVVHDTDADGQPLLPASIGAVPIPAGESRSVVVDLIEPLQPGDQVVVMLHADTGRAGVLEFGTASIAEDKPLMQDGRPVSAIIDLN